MTLIYNIEPVDVNLVFNQGDIIDMDFFINELLLPLSTKFYAGINSAPGEGTSFAMADLHIQVRRKDSLLIKDWQSGVSPSDIVIGNGTFHLFDDEGFLESGFFDFDLKCDNGLGEFTIMQGSIHVKKQITI